MLLALILRCKAALLEWEECLKILEPTIKVNFDNSVVAEDSEVNPSETSFLESAIYLLRGTKDIYKIE